MYIQILDTDTQRNGVGGEPFVAVRFLSDEYPRPLIAVIPTRYMPHDDPDMPNLAHEGWSSTFVVDPEDLTQHWRGDVLYAELVDAGLWQRVSESKQVRSA